MTHNRLYWNCRRSLASATEQVGVLRTEKAALRAELASEAQRCKEEEARSLNMRRRLEASQQAEIATTGELEGMKEIDCRCKEKQVIHVGTTW